MTKRNFDKILLEAIDETLGMLGESAKQSTYFHLEHKFKITREDIPRHLKDFEGGLERIFGLGAKYLEISIMKKLYEKTDRPPEWNEDEELVFDKYVEAIRKGLLEKRRAETAAS